MPSGRARISTRRPQAIGECDRCGFWVNMHDLRPQMQWSGNKLINTGLLVCQDTCLDRPQEQYRTPILPPDPRPVIPSRPSPNVTPQPFTIRGNPIGLLPPSPENQGFTEINLDPSFPTTLNYPPTQAGVLAQIAAATGVATPAAPNLASYIVPMTRSTVTLVPPNTTRSYLAIFNPTQFPAQISLGTAVNGAISNLSIGPNQVYIQAAGLNVGPVYTGAITAIGMFPNLPLWAWENETNLAANLINDQGVLQLASVVTFYPTTYVGLPAGAVWNDGFVIGVVPGITPNPAAPKLFFGSITAATLLSTGGGNLPLTDPGNPFQLWNDNGLVCVSLGSGGGTSPSLDFSQAGNSQYLAGIL